MRRVIFFILICFCSSVFANPKEIYNGIINSTFKTAVFKTEKEITFYDDANTDIHDFWNQSFTYSIHTEGKFSVMNLMNENYRKSFLILKSDLCLLMYDTETSECLFSGMNIPVRETETVYFPENVIASSELREKTKIYAAENIANFKLDSPWCEGVDGNGIGQKLMFNLNASKLVIITGYVAATKKYLFDANSRPKKISVFFVNLNESKKFDLLDSPNPQVINFGKNYNGKIEIRIEEVYKGNKYSDTCISTILCKYMD